MRPRTGRWLLPAAGLALTLGVPCALSGQRAGAGTAVPFLPREEETRIALSAAPEHLRGEAGVYALTPAGFVRVRESRNGFTCVINRDHP